MLCLLREDTHRGAERRQALIPIAIGFDPRETAAYHVLEQSIINRTTQPVAIIPLHEPMLSGFDGQQDGTNAFIYSRFLVPELMDFRGWAIYVDSDMLLRSDLAELWALRDETKAVMVCRHEYETKTFRKLIGTPMESQNEHYPRKNWSSMILWNCGHPQNRILTREFVAEAGGRRLHRFEWLADDLVGSVPLSWNHLVGDYQHRADADLVHFTYGAPGFPYYRNSDYADEWRRAEAEVNRMDQLEEARRAWR